LTPALPTLHSHFDGETWTVNADDSALGWMNAGWHRDAHGRAVLQLVAGTPPSVVRAAYWNGRLLLIDGHHRVRALRACGVNFVPCMVAACEDEADVLALAPHLRGQDLAPWFEAVRPPMLRDHDRVSLVYRHQARRENRQVQVKITYRQA
jgi:ParB-like nuclease domain